MKIEEIIEKYKGREITEEGAKAFESMLVPLEEEFPKHGDIFFFTDIEGDISQSTCIDDGDLPDFQNITLGISPSREEQQAITDEVRSYTRLVRCIKKWQKKIEPDWKCDWEDSMYNYFFESYRGSRCDVYFSASSLKYPNSLYFSEEVGRNKDFLAEAKPLFLAWLGIEND